MVRLFYTEVKHTEEPAGNDYLSAAAKQARDAGLRHSEKLHKAAHECLRQGVLSCLTGLYAQRVRAVKLSLAYGPHGKPYLTSHPAICFSISHAGHVALCVVSEMEIGADIQDHREMKDERIRKLAARFYAHEEQEKLAQTASGEECKALFFRIWAAKEAYAKFTGKGLAEDFTRFYADLDTMCIRKSGQDSTQKAGKTHSPVLAYLQEPLLLPGYSCVICTEDRVPGAETEELTLDETFTAVFPGEPTAAEALKALQSREKAATP